MKIGRLETLTSEINPSVATIGFFDGVHLGHSYLIDQLKAESASKNLESTIITFDSHPRKVLKKDFQPSLLNTLEEKKALLAKTGVDNVIIIHFDDSIASLSAFDFMSSMLKRKLNVSELLIGYDNMFGHNRMEGFDDYVRFGKELNIEVKEALPLIVDDSAVSSSRVRKLLQAGDVRNANKLLGYEYKLEGTVVHGNHIGATLGFPTANMGMIDEGKLIPKGGVYCVRCMTSDSSLRTGMTNIGTRPTFYTNDEVTVETNILDFNEDIYDEHFYIFFVDRIRDEQKFSSKEELIQQLNKDLQICGSL